MQFFRIYKYNIFLINHPPTCQNVIKFALVNYLNGFCCEMFNYLQLKEERDEQFQSAE